MKNLLTKSLLTLGAMVVFSAAAWSQYPGQYASTGHFYQEPVPQSTALNARNGYGCDSRFGQGCDSHDASSCGGCCNIGDCCRYFTVFGGWVEADSSTLRFATLIGRPESLLLEMEYNSGWLIGSAVGRRLNRNWRMELEGAYRNHSFDEAVGGMDVVPLDGRINVVSGMANIYRDFGQGNACRRWQPYVGAGAGFAFVNANPNAFGSGLDFDDSAFAAQGMAGVAYRTSACSQLFAEYRVFGTDDLYVRSVQSQIAGPTATDLFTDYLSHNFVFGMRFYR